MCPIGVAPMRSLAAEVTQSNKLTDWVGVAFAIRHITPAGASPRSAGQTGKREDQHHNLQKRRACRY